MPAFNLLPFDWVTSPGAQLQYRRNRSNLIYVVSFSYGDVICVSTIKHSVFRKIHLSSVTKYLVFYRQPAKHPHKCLYLNEVKNQDRSRVSTKIKASIGLSMPKNPYNNLSFETINGLNFSHFGFKF